ncbi:hypothetical protein COO60DRAFT_1511722, partial [Scenedesmus sp. NREL 46B-D3]
MTVWAHTCYSGQAGRAAGAAGRRQPASTCRKVAACPHHHAPQAGRPDGHTTRSTSNSAVTAHLHSMLPPSLMILCTTVRKVMTVAANSKVPARVARPLPHNSRHSVDVSTRGTARQLRSTRHRLLHCASCGALHGLHSQQHHLHSSTMGQACCDVKLVLVCCRSCTHITCRGQHALRGSRMLEGCAVSITALTIATSNKTAAKECPSCAAAPAASQNTHTHTLSPGLSHSARAPQCSARTRLRGQIAQPPGSLAMCITAQPCA